MSSGIDKLAKGLQEVIDQKEKKKTSGYDVKATVSRKDGDILWVQIPGGVEETPIQKTVDADVDDEVLVRIADGKAWCIGNATNPPADNRLAAKAVEFTARAIGAMTGTNPVLDGSDIENLVAKNSTILNSYIDDARIVHSNIENLTAENSTIKNSIVENFNVIDGVVQGLRATDAEIQGNLTAASADIQTLRANKADINAANITDLTSQNAWIDKLMVQSGLISHQGTVYTLDAIQVNAANITAGTINVERLVVTVDGEKYLFNPKGYYYPTEDTAIVQGKVYYTVTATAVSNPNADNLASYYELVNSKYKHTLDLKIVSGKTYYTLQGTAVASPVVDSLSSYYELKTYEKLHGDILEKRTITADKIVAGSITAQEITTENIVGTGGWINLRNGTFRYVNATSGNGIAWDGTNLTIQGNVTITGGNVYTKTQVDGAVSAAQANGAKTATNYLTYIDGTNGLRIYDGNSSNKNVNFSQVNASGLQIYKGGTAASNLVASFGESVQIGKSANTYITLDTDKLRIYKGSDELLQICAKQEGLYSSSFIGTVAEVSEAYMKHSIWGTLAQTVIHAGPQSGYTGGIGSVTCAGSGQFSKVDMHCEPPNGTSGGVATIHMYGNKVATGGYIELIASGTNLRIESARATLNGDLIFSANGRSIGGTKTDGTTTILNICPLNSSNNFILGWGSYDASLGATNIYGNSMGLYSKGTITLSANRSSSETTLTLGSVVSTNRSIYMTANASYLYGRKTDNSTNVLLCGINADNNLFFGYGGYTGSFGTTYFDGNNVSIRSNGSISFNKYLRVTDSGKTSYFGCQNATYCHIYTDASEFAVNKSLAMVGNGNIGTDTYPTGGVTIRNNYGLRWRTTSSTTVAVMWLTDDSPNILHIGSASYDTHFYSSTLCYFHKGISVASSIYSEGTISSSGNATFNSQVTIPNMSTSSSSANVRIGTASPVGRLYRSTASSRRYKHDIVDLSIGAVGPRKLYDIPVRQFKYNADYLSPEDARSNKDLPGFIAEELYEVYPIAVDLDDSGQPEDWNVRYILPPMLALIQEQKKEIDELKARLDALVS